MCFDFWINLKYLDLEHLVALPDFFDYIQPFGGLTKDCMLSIEMFSVFLIKDYKELTSTSIPSSMSLVGVFVIYAP